MYSAGLRVVRDSLESCISSVLRVECGLIECEAEATEVTSVKSSKRCGVGFEVLGIARCFWVCFALEQAI